MKILVIGGGSMGRRRLRDLTYLHPGGVLLHEPVAERCKQVSEAFGVRGFTGLDEALEQRLDTLVVSTPPALHGAYVRRGLEAGLHVFAEVPYLLDYDELKQVAANSGEQVLAIGCEANTANAIRMTDQSAHRPASFDVPKPE